MVAYNILQIILRLINVSHIVHGQLTDSPSKDRDAVLPVKEEERRISTTTPSTRFEESTVVPLQPAAASFLLAKPQAGEETLHPLFSDVEEVAASNETPTVSSSKDPYDDRIYSILYSSETSTPPPKSETTIRDNNFRRRPNHPPFGGLQEETLDSAVREALSMKSSADPTEQALYRKLMDIAKYEKDVRPTTHHSLATNVTFGFLLNQIVEMDERNQVLTTRSWLNINWLDPRLTWNHTLWGGIKTIYVPYQKLWKPDIILVNNAIREYHASLVSTDIMVSSDGNVTFLYSAIFRSSCRIKVRYYPFDDQECDLKFASWSHDIREIDLGLNTDKGDLSSYMNNSEFDLVDMIAIREVVPFPSAPDFDWPIIVIRINMRRRPLFYVFNHIIPCVLISSMAVLGFLMPPETGEKINMIITTLLSMGVYLQSITESIPPTSEAVPLIGMYYVASLFMVCLATCVNVITLNIHRNGAANQGRHVPQWMEKYILGYLASFMHMTIREPDSIALIKTAQTKKSTIRRSSILRDLKRIKNTENRKGLRSESASECECMQEKRDSLTPTDLCVPVLSNGSSRSDHIGESAFLGRIVGEQLLPRMTTSRPLMLTEFETKFRKILKRIYRSLQQHEIREEILDERLRIQWQWQQLASVVDRLLLIMFFCATVCTITFFLVLPVSLRDSASQHLLFL